MQTYLCKALIRFELNHESEARKDIDVVKRFDPRLAEVGRLNFRGVFGENSPGTTSVQDLFAFIAPKRRISSYFSRLPFVRASRSDRPTRKCNTSVLPN